MKHRTVFSRCNGRDREKGPLMSRPLFGQNTWMGEIADSLDVLCSVQLLVSLLLLADILIGVTRFGV